MRKLTVPIAQGSWKSILVLPAAYISLMCLTGATPLPHPHHQSSAAANSPVSAVVGDWRGTSTCVLRESACHDEDSLYHFSAVAVNSHAVSLKADKIVDGKPVTMGTGNCDFDSAKLQITCPLPSASLAFHVQGKEMTGTMTLSNGTLWRKLSLKKVD
jgi:hypothetical protein